nr:NADH-quinone oxidoreductase subunit B [candidate division Zixibacteria bacterium]NIR62254.1 NADH-quinone oxidoreductase subunit B [candidate division Zixibacteria bacterium]NIS14825.1 NADH-quinone oxidoreductase subunit B [candidate division Zixibacteria bacterium]NIS44490.1 NADH-quinone oxidoreductase subunit B [candidate division Zixibacteria bacterium]NIT51363.1 NADH-quinone oxidoreductase subunit B [candidate division Zixibacteria bacterium]
KMIPVDMYIPGCPPRPQQLIDGIVKLHEKVKNEKLKQPIEKGKKK